MRLFFIRFIDRTKKEGAVASTQARLSSRFTLKPSNIIVLRMRQSENEPRAHAQRRQTIKKWAVVGDQKR